MELISYDVYTIEDVLRNVFRPENSTLSDYSGLHLDLGFFRMDHYIGLNIVCKVFAQFFKLFIDCLLDLITSCAFLLL